MRLKHGASRQHYEVMGKAMKTAAASMHHQDSCPTVMHTPRSFAVLKIIRQVGHAMRNVNKEEKLAEKWISSKMLARVLEVTRTSHAPACLK